MSHIIVFIFAWLIGFAVGGIFGMLMTDIKIEPIIRTGIDADELIGWIENYTHNYEWTSPPTTGEIIKHIREMEERCIDRKG